MRKCQPEEVLNTSFSSSGKSSGYENSSDEEFGHYRRNSSSSDESPNSPKFNKLRKSVEDKPLHRTFSETDKVTDWEWSRGFSLGVQASENMILSVMIREDVQNKIQSGLKSHLLPARRKIIRVTKKLINATVFIIFEEEDSKFPMFRIVNEC